MTTRNVGAHALRWALGAFMLIIAAMTFLSSSGCAPKAIEVTSSLTGKITLDGEPVKAGLIRLQTNDGKQAEGRITPDGIYVVSGPPEGEVVLAVIRPQVMGGKFGPGRGADKQMPDVKDSGKIRKDREIEVPPEKQALFDTIKKMPQRYSSMETSGLKTTIVAGTNEYDIKMTTK